MKGGKLKKLLLDYELPTGLIILALGIAIRFIALGLLPYGLNQDEASAGFDAWALLNYGIDRCGNSWPVLLESWGSGQNVLYSIIAMPFIALFGLSELTFRIPMALSGSLTLFIFWRLARRCRGELFGLAALFCLAFCPWHIMASRWALESNLLPTMLLLGIYLVVVSREKHWLLVAAAAVFGLSLYAYGTAFFFLPLFLIVMTVWLRRDLRYSSFFTALAVFVLIALPIGLCQFINLAQLDEIHILGITLPKLTQARQMSTSIFGGGSAVLTLRDNFGTLVKILKTGSDGLNYNALSPWGLFYPFGLPLIFVGLAVSLGTRKDYPLETPMRWALAISLLCALMINGNINRLNMLWLPMAYFMAVGFYSVCRLLRVFSAAAIAAVLACFLLFAFDYSGCFGRDGTEISYFPGLGDAIEYAASLEPESVYISSSYVNAPYIFALFYTETPPGDFTQTVDYINPDGAFRSVSSFGIFSFGGAESAHGEYLILHRSEAFDREVLASFGRYCVCAGDN